MRDALLRQLAERVADFGDSGAPDVVLDDAGVKAAEELTAVVGDVLDERRAVDTDILRTVAAYHWARSLAHTDSALSAAEHMRAMHVFGLLYVIDHRRVPRELWGQLTMETGHDPWRDPVDHASDLVLDAAEGGDSSALDEAMALLHGSPSSPYRDTTLGLALHHRAGSADRPVTDRLVDADSAIELFARVAALPEESPARRAYRQLTLANAFTQRFELSADYTDLTGAESAARRAFSEAPEGSPEQAAAAEGIGVSLGRRADEEPVPEAATLLRGAVRRLRLAVDLDKASGREPVDRSDLRKAMGLLLNRTALGPDEEQQGEVWEARADSAPLAPDDVRNVLVLGDLASKIVARVIPEAEAVRRVIAPTFAISKEAVGYVVDAAIGPVGSGAAEDLMPALTLTLEASAARWGTGPESPWWRASDTYVEAARLSLGRRPDGTLFHRARDVVRRKIEVLRERNETDDLAKTLFAAGLLHLSPYFGEVPGTGIQQRPRPLAGSSEAVPVTPPGRPRARRRP
ncbi:hypothetical protein K378_04034 [Streptomyces sp. Amel2xB2]|uniref:hypothetical protein n=1 Tax=Streptomyces sp. Amel2xB2 TaxID=1305829 RepID=UPI000DBFDCBC|nr:hypothetical protein [Streptomyces sp. Amel2xB2]RAJ61674.1 hypothetical protein K378_04034 [Streptomyces sp. Amel2xB2]